MGLGSWDYEDLIDLDLPSGGVSLFPSTVVYLKENRTRIESLAPWSRTPLKLPYGQNRWHKYQKDPKGRLVKGPYKPICRDCAIYFWTTVTARPWKSILGTWIRRWSSKARSGFKVTLNQPFEVSRLNPHHPKKKVTFESPVGYIENQ